MITRALALRQAGNSLERAAAGATADGQLDPELVKRWAKRFRVVEGQLIEVNPPVVTFRQEPARWMLVEPARSRSPELRQEV